MLTGVNTPSEHFSDTVAGITTMLAAHHDGLMILGAVTAAYKLVLAADATGVLVTDPRGRVEVLAASDERARFTELLQVHVRQGPCLECLESNTTVSIADLGAAGDRWPDFASAATEQGFHAVYAFPLRLIDHAVGGINVLYNKATTLSARQVRQGQALADLAMLGLTQERDQRRVERLAERTLGTLNDRAQVSQAVGMLAAALDLEPDVARAHLSAYSARTSTAIRAVAQALTSGSLTPEVMLPQPR
jgi:transcriptional regulator with GAF, ATPase, and Fis domain